MLYLASPYSHPNKWMRHKRYYDATVFAARLASRKIVVIPPITMSHPMQMFYDMPGSWEYWKSIDTELLSKCDHMIVYMLDGWQKSVGVQAEIKIAEQMKIPIGYIPPDITDEDLDRFLIALIGTEI